MDEQVLVENHKKILIIEDDPILRKMYAEKFSKAKFEVLTAENGEHVVDMVKKEKPEVILLDLLMPKVDGFATLKNLKADPETENIPIMVLSVVPEDVFMDEVEENLKDKIAGYIRKDQNNPAQIVEEVKKLLPS